MDKDPGDDLLSHGKATLPSAQLCFTSEFGMGSGGTTALLSPGRGWRVAGCFQESLHRDVQALAEGSAYSSATLSRGGRRVNERLEQAINVLRPRVTSQGEAT